MSQFYHFVAISGSLRKGSYNTMLLKAAQKLPPINVVIEQLPIDKVPMYNINVHQNGFPPEVDKLIDTIKAADAVIFVTPEYHYATPGLLKNAIDFFSRSAKKPFSKKAVAVMSANPGQPADIGLQCQLRQTLLAENAHVMNKPAVRVEQASAKFDATGNLTDENTKELISNFIESLAVFSAGFKEELQHASALAENTLTDPTSMAKHQNTRQAAMM